MQSFTVRIQERNFNGLYNSVPGDEVPPGYFFKLDNAFCSDSKIKKVFGSTAINTAIATQPFNGFYGFEIPASGNKWLVASLNGASNAQLYQSTGGNFSAIGSANLTNSKPVWFEVANSILYGFNGSEVVTWDGTSVVKNPATVPNGFYAKWFHNYLFVGNTATSPNRLFWSKLGDPTNFAGGIATYSVNTGGSGYSVGDVLTVTGGGGVGAQVVVATLSGSGVASVNLLSAGSGYSVTTGAATSEAATGKTGLGFLINILSIDATTLSNFVDVNPGDSDQIMGLVGFPGQDELLVFKRNTIWSITGYSGASFAATTVATQNTNARINGYGTVAPFSIVPVGNEVYFFSMLGNTPVIRSLTKTINAVTLGGGVISEGIKATMDTINKSHLSGITSIFDGRYAYWSVPMGASTTNNLIICLDTWEINKSKDVYPFSTMTGKNASYFAQSTLPGFANVYFSDAASTGLVFKYDTSVFTDNGVNITMDVQTRDYSSSLANKTKWKYLYFTYDTGSAANVAVNSRIDRATNFTNQATISMQGNSPGLGMFILGTSLLGGQGTTATRVTFQQVLGHYLGVEFKDTTNNAVVIHDWEILGQQKRLRAS